MALKKTFETKMGVSGEYINFDLGISDKTNVQIKLNFWKDKATRDTEGALPYNDQMEGGRTERIVGFDTLYSFTLDLNSDDNIYEQAYTYLKTLPAFAGAVDC